MPVRDYLQRLQILNEFWLFARTNKKLWLFPTLALLILLSLFILFAESSVLAPFIYSLF